MEVGSAEVGKPRQTEIKTTKKDIGGGQAMDVFSKTLLMPVWVFWGVLVCFGVFLCCFGVFLGVFVFSCSECF